MLFSAESAPTLEEDEASYLKFKGPTNFLQAYTRLLEMGLTLARPIALIGRTDI